MAAFSVEYSWLDMVSIVGQGASGLFEQVDLMETKFKEFMSNENERLERDVKAADARSAAVAAERAAKRHDQWEAICASRQQQLDARADHKQQQVLEEQAFAAAWKVWPASVACTFRDRHQMQWFITTVTVGSST